jgi:hypothetical protein
MSTYNPVGDVMDWSLSSMKGGLPSPMMDANRLATDPTAGLSSMNYDQHVMKPGETGYDLKANDPGAGWDWQGAMKGFSTGAQGVLGLANAYNAYRQMKLMEDQFDFAKQDRNQMIANQAAITNANLDAQASARSQLSGNTVGSEGYEKDMANRTQVSGAPI